MTAPTESEIDSVIAGLSEAQRTLVRAARETLFGRMAIFFKRDNATKRILRTENLTEEHGVRHDRLTPLGIAVRARLEAMKDG